MEGIEKRASVEKAADEESISALHSVASLLGASLEWLRRPSRMPRARKFGRDGRPLPMDATMLRPPEAMGPLPYPPPAFPAAAVSSSVLRPYRQQKSFSLFFVS